LAVVDDVPGDPRPTCPAPIEYLLQMITVLLSSFIQALEGV
jgi:hypothetical protein